MYMTSTTSEIYAASGIGARTGWGSRPALLVVDLQTGFTDPKSGVGGELGDVVDATARLTSGFRHGGLPVMFTAVGFQEGEPSNWLRKMPGLAVLREGGLVRDRPAAWSAQARAILGQTGSVGVLRHAVVGAPDLIGH
jgi:nicotinamidase-related amidase